MLRQIENKCQCITNLVVIVKLQYPEETNLSSEISHSYETLGTIGYYNIIFRVLWKLSCKCFCISEKWYPNLMYYIESSVHHHYNITCKEKFRWFLEQLRLPHTVAEKA